MTRKPCHGPSICLSDSAACFHGPVSTADHRSRSLLNLVLSSSSFHAVNIVHHFVLRVNSDYQPSLPVTAINIPYLITPQLMQSLSSPIRLFFWADMALGPYGTALIIDSNQDESQNDLAQRLAGQMLCRLGNGSGSDDDMLLATSSNAVVSEEPVNGFPSMAFLVRDQDTWTRVTMDEQAGKVAFARVDGGVELLEYI